MKLMASYQDFIQNKYLKWYVTLCERGVQRAKTRAEAKKLLGYVEKHHILPRCIGGGNQKNNLVFLTAREHFVAYRFLTKFITNEKMNRYEV